MQSCRFGSRAVGKGCYVFNRRSDHLRCAVLSMVERCLNPSLPRYLVISNQNPLKKYHVASLLNLCFRNFHTVLTVIDVWSFVCWGMCTFHVHYWKSKNVTSVITMQLKENFCHQLSCYFVHSTLAIYTSCLFPSVMNTKLCCQTHNSLDSQEWCFLSRR